MTENQIRLEIGSLLHDIGKIIYRCGGSREKHSISGANYLEEEIKIQDSAILNCVRFHHSGALSEKGNELKKNDYAYITYYADNVASAADRREKEDDEEGSGGFKRDIPLESIFNLLNRNKGRSHWGKQIQHIQQSVPYPTEENVTLDCEFYKQILQNITENLRSFTFTEEYLNSLLAVLESSLSYIPSSTSQKEQADISLYDHVKITAAVAQCIAQYMEEQQEEDYEKALYRRATKTYKEKMFLLYSMDLSGIQNFIYTIGSEGALKGLRARSFYLEIMMEHIIDELLQEASLSRSNLIYSGGGHCYLLLPNTEKMRQTIENHEKMVNEWFMDYFGTDLFAAGAYAVCSADDLKNKPNGQYRKLYEEISKKISQKKMHRYEPSDILRLNNKKHSGERECKICRRIAKVNEKQQCPVCASLEKLSGNILYQDFFTVTQKEEKDSLPLPGNKFLTADTKESLIARMNHREYVRSYSKNLVYIGKNVIRLWVGDYTTGDTFEEFAENSEGIKRIGILRADVDNLGKAFLNGFERANEKETETGKYATLSRTATLSRQLSLFFKGYINQILKHGTIRLKEEKPADTKRNISIVYSGGDDMFLVGSWNEIIEAFMDIKEAFRKFTQNTLTLSAGIGIYHSGYPINIMAKETERLEEQAKNLDGKNGVCLFETAATYPWDIFKERVIGEKFSEIRQFFEKSDEYGKAFLYHLLDLLRDGNEEEESEKKRINIPRYVYFLSRMEPGAKSTPEQQEAYQRFSKKMYEWRKDRQSCRELISAIYLYVYLTRKK